MSNPESFVDEVNEELRRDRLFAFLRKYGWIAVVAVLALVGYAAWSEWARARALAEAQAFGDALLTALEAQDPEARRRDLAALSSEHRGANRQALVKLLIAAEALAVGDRTAALTTFAEVAADPALPLTWRQLATLKRVFAATEENMPLTEREAALAELAAPGSPFRPLALELKALLRLEAGDQAGAEQTLSALLQEAGLTANTRARLTELLLLLGARSNDAGAPN